LVTHHSLATACLFGFEQVDVLPRDMVFVMRAMHLIKDLNEELLGGSRAERFHRYVLLAAGAFVHSD
jgi:hypothetical protein